MKKFASFFVVVLKNLATKFATLAADTSSLLTIGSQVDNLVW
jgi:hypothetical protein